MTAFNPCKGKTACRDDGATCLTCGRSFEEIEITRRLIDALADLAIDKGYDNIDEFAAYVARKLVSKVTYRMEHRGGSEAQ